MNQYSVGAPEICVPSSHSPASQRFARSRQMVSCLKGELLYSVKRARDLMFSAVERTLSDVGAGPMIVSRLTREAVARARIDADRLQFVLASWDTTGRAVINAMLCAEVLLTPDGVQIRRDVGAHAAVVVGLRDGYRDATEASLIEFLIRRMADVTTRDHTALAHALFRHFDDRVPMDYFEDRVAILIARLADRVALRGDQYVAT